MAVSASVLKYPTIAMMAGITPQAINAAVGTLDFSEICDQTLWPMIMRSRAKANSRRLAAACRLRPQERKEIPTTRMTAREPTGPKACMSTVWIGSVSSPEITLGMFRNARINARQVNIAAAPPI